jgi:DinB family protein
LGIEHWALSIDNRHMNDDAIRDHLVRVLDWEEAHVGFDKAIDGIPADRRGAVAPGFEHSPWQLLEHIRLAQDDIYDFCVNPKYEHTMTWPDDYWPQPAPPNEAAWSRSIASVVQTRDKLKALAREVTDLNAKVPTGKGSQTYLRAILLVADHNAYHVGQLVAVRRALGVWK